MRFFGLLLCCVPFATFAMESNWWDDLPELQEDDSSYESILEDSWEQGWASIGDVLLGLVTVQELFNNQGPLLSDVPFSSDLPSDMRMEIVAHLISASNASSLQEAALSIRNLSEVNKALYELINSSEFCFKLIHHLAAKFSTNEVDVARELHTPAAKGYLVMMAAKNHDKDMIEQVVSMPGVKINLQSSSGMTALMFSVGAMGNLEIARLLVQYPGININMQDNRGDTALMRVLNDYILAHMLGANEDQLKVFIQLLIDAGANPLLGNAAEETPFKRALQTQDKDVIALISRAIAERP
jgi:hypothetical protein